MRANGKMTFFTAALVGAVLATASAAPARAEGGWLWFESGSLFPVYRQVTPAYQTPRRIVQRPRVAAVVPQPVPAPQRVAALPVSTGGSFWGSSRIYVSGLSF